MWAVLFFAMARKINWNQLNSWYEIFVDPLMRFISIAMAVVMATSCANSSTSATGSENDSTATSPVSQKMSYSGCYRQVIKRDTILLRLQQSGAALTGVMAFDNYEKDSSHGTINGSVENGLLVFWYRFFSEGTESVMQVVLRPTESGMIRATGEMINRGDTALFKDPGALQFDNNAGLIKVACE
jgi:hypothetical protein